VSKLIFNFFEFTNICSIHEEKMLSTIMFNESIATGLKKKERDYAQWKHDNWGWKKR